MKRLFLSSFTLLFTVIQIFAQVNQVGSTGPVGIGTGVNTPQAYLHVFRPASPALYTPITIFEDAISNGYTQIAFKGTGRQYHIGVGNNSEGAFGIANKFYIWDQFAELPRFVVDASGNIGIGTSTPANRVSIYSATANTSGLQFSRLNNTATAVAGNGKVLSLDASGNVILVNESLSGGGWALNGNSGSNPSTNFIGTSDNQPLVFRSNNLEAIRLLTNGNLGIGTNAPANRLSIYSASDNSSGLQFARLNNTATAVAGNGKVLSLDASGNVILVNESLSGGGWALNGNSGSNPSTNFIGTSDNQPLVFRSNNLEAIRLLTNGNLGIGTNAPANRLSIYSASANSSGLQFARLNNTATAVAGNGKVLSLDAAGNVILVNESVGSSSGWGLTGNTGTNPTTNFIGTSDNQPLIFKANNSEIMRIAANGNISIGTNDAKGHKFAVNGDAVFTKIKVKALLNWPDYVFSPEYDLRSLDVLETYINTHKHLPEIPSASEIEKEGLDVANNQAALLKKIEELTLYIISQNKMITQQEKLITGLQDSFNEQKKDLDQIRMKLQKTAN